jgi:hypothetical protein
MASQVPEVVFALEGERNPRSLKTHPDSSVTEFIALVVKDTGREEFVEVLIEDEDGVVPGEKPIRELFVAGFKLIHVATKGEIKVTIQYSTRSVSRDFRPSATMEKIIRWAISPEELNLEGGPEDFQLKDGNDVLPADVHLGQLTKGHKHVTLTLVFKVKPQG